MNSNNELKLLTWNVNGIRSLYKDANAVKEGLQSLDADIICLQETKLSRSCLDRGTAVIEGYNSYYSFAKYKDGYSGVATYCKDAYTPICAEEGLSGLLVPPGAEDNVGCYGNIRTEFSKREIKELDYEGRAVITLHKIMMSFAAEDDKLAIINVYCPRAEPGDKERQQMKLRFYQLLELRARALTRSGILVVIVGDLNTYHKPIDHCDPPDEVELMSDPCRKWLDQLIYDPHEPIFEMNGNVNRFQMNDAFRMIHPNEASSFSCWPSKLNARSNNYGSRIDFILLDMIIDSELEECTMMQNVEGSDHCPVKARMHMTVIKSPKCPSFCTRYFPELAGKQTKLLDYFVELSAPGTSSSKGEIQDICTNPKKEKKEMKSQRSITSFFQLKEDSEDLSSGHQSDVDLLSATSSLSSLVYGESIPDEVSADKEEATSSSHLKEETALTGASASAAWKKVFSGPKPPPNCLKHGEPCVMKVAKTKGQNFNRKFWVCNRGKGRKDDPNGSCDFFLWDSSR